MPFTDRLPTLPHRGTSAGNGSAPRGAELALRSITGNISATTSHHTAWFVLPEQPWAFRQDTDRAALLEAQADQFAKLAGYRIHLRRTARPYDATGWAHRLEHDGRPLPDAPDAPTWRQHIGAGWRHVVAGNYSVGHTLLGVTFPRRRRVDPAAAAAQLGEHLAGPGGLDAAAATIPDILWMIYRSVAPGFLPPDHALVAAPVGAADIAAITERYERFRDRYGATTRIVDRHTGAQRHLVVLTVGRMEPLTIPELHDPWLHLADLAPFDVDVSARVDLLHPEAAAKSMNRKLLGIRADQREYRARGLDEPVELEENAGRARDLEHQIRSGRPVDGVRAHGWFRLVVTGTSRDEVLDRARQVTDLYRREARIQVDHPKDQPRIAQEIIPGQPVADTGYLRRMPVRMLAAALPQAASPIGDGRGDLLGVTASTTRRPVMLDPHHATEIRERSGVIVLVADPGGGKSTIMGSLGYLAAVRGVQVTLLDPSGPLAALCRMPALAGRARELNLTGAEPGTLAPYALVPTPTRVDYPQPDAVTATGTVDGFDNIAPPGGTVRDPLDIATGNARAERRGLVQDIVTMLLPPSVARRDDVATAVRDAIRLVPADETSTLEHVVDALRGAGPTGVNVANLLMDAADMPLAELFFGSPPAGTLGDGTALTVITMSGLRLPDMTVERDYWSAEELLALPMLHTAHRLAVRRCYSGPSAHRKLVGLDEAHVLEGWRSGHTFQTRLARDSRKWNIAALIASQNPGDILRLDQVNNLVSTVFVGRVADDPEVAAGALRLLRLPAGVGYEQVIAGLSQQTAAATDRLGYREFVMRDVDGRVQKIRVDVSWVPGLLDVLDTTPAQIPAPVGQPATGRRGLHAVRGAA